MNQVSSIQCHVCNVEYNFIDTKLTSNCCISFAASLAKASGLVCLLGGSERHAEKTPARCDEGAELLVAHVFAGDERRSLVGLGWFSSRFNILSADGFDEMPGSRRVGEFLCRFREQDLIRLRELALLWLGHLSTVVAHHYRY